MDNASANDVAVAYMARRLTSYKTLMFKGEYLHLCCACHIINLIVKDGLKELEDAVVLIWNCAEYIRSSSSKLDKFKEFAVLDGMKANANVPLDVVTRWNNTYIMFYITIMYEHVFSRIAEEDPKFKGYFKEKDKNGKERVRPPVHAYWRNAGAFYLFLKKFYDATLKLSAWKSITANILLGEMITLQTEIIKKMTSEDEVMRNVAALMKIKFNKYWGSFELINKLIMITNVLDSRYKLQYAKAAMERVNESYQTIRLIQGDLKRILVKMYTEYRDKDSDNQSKQTANVGDFDIGEVDLASLNEVTRTIAMEMMATQTQSILNEVDQYLSDRYVSLFTKDFHIHTWWRANEGVYPVISRPAKDILAIPCSTMASENAFSLGLRVIDPYRASLTPKTVEALVCTLDWLRNEHPQFYKDPTVDELSIYSMENLRKMMLSIKEQMEQ